LGAAPRVHPAAAAARREAPDLVLSLMRRQRLGKKRKETQP